MRNASVRYTSVAGLLITVAIFGSMAASPALAQQSARAATPDLSGIWFPSFRRRSRTPDPLPFTDAARGLVDDYAQRFELEDDPGYYCVWPGMPRAVWGAPFAIEIMHRPDELTIIWEGYGMWRKIYMADRDPPEAILPTAMGHSIAHWEGDTLVIETTDLKPYPYMNRFPTTANAHIVERMRVEEREEDGELNRYIIDEIVLTDPQMYTEPVRIAAEAQFRADLDLLEYNCSITLWEEHLTERALTLPDVDALPAPAN
ncbi:hypothetical protein [Candidatus Rariloculus sp.]|uniref:hypothetical protein n=1 Tax=Candidatus Rariloculus sp. TaxID=3101265 RepID=UPI003D0C7B50